jgi:predicted nucleic acid-binding protein
MAEFVVDASIVCCWVLPDENSSAAAAAFAILQIEDAVAPDLLWHEVRNVLMLAHRRKRVDFSIVSEAVRVLRGLNIFTRSIENEQSILDLAERHGLTAYDAAYLALAVERHAVSHTRQAVDCGGASRERNAHRLRITLQALPCSMPPIAAA